MNETVQKDDALIEKYLPEGAEEYVEDSLFTDRELVAYLLWKRTGLTFDEAAEEMGISYGTFSGKIGNNVKEKKERARATVELIRLIEGE